MSWMAKLKIQPTSSSLGHLNRSISILAFSVDFYPLSVSQATLYKLLNSGCYKAGNLAICKKLTKYSAIRKNMATRVVFWVDWPIGLEFTVFVWESDKNNILKK